MNWFTSLFKKQTPEGSQNESQTLRLELVERDRQIAQLKSDIERQRREAESRQQTGLQAELTQLLTDLAAPLTQLRTQAHLLEAEGRPVAARDVLTVARRLTRSLEDYGLQLEDTVGAQTAFDPNLHEALSGASALQPGQAVIVRFSRVSLNGRVLRKAGVEAA
jgi:molecular chaperone GrpE (heat shock protein)